jgi:ketosteroid isomerase-like protein
MKGDETAVEVQRINSEFYHAFESLSIENMDRLWKHEDDNAVCIHPGWDLFTGWLAIRESWITIFRNTEKIKFIITNTKIRTFDNIAVVVCLENIETSINGQITRFGVIATNVFEHDEENGWLLFHHHGSSVSNYIPPNISSEY